MCLLFVYINPAPTPGDYAVIIANTRDELFNRATKPASQWLPDHPHCVGGLDLEKPGYGTWQAISTRGKIASLLNILSLPKPNAKSRGDLVTDYVTSTIDATSYLNVVNQDDADHSYQAFKLVLIENKFAGAGWNMYSYSNKVDKDIEIYNSGIHVFNNSNSEKAPWLKAVYGKQLFETLVNKFNGRSQESELVNSLFSLLRDRKCNFPDPVLEQQGSFLNTIYPGRLQELAHICVQSRKPDYGSRTHTVILVDHSGCCQYIERTMKEPIDLDNPEWLTTRLQQQMSLRDEDHSHKL